MFDAGAGAVTDLQVSCELGPHGKYTRPPVHFKARKTVLILFYYAFPPTIEHVKNSVVNDIRSTHTFCLDFLRLKTEALPRSEMLATTS